jgi:hypothetical protein
MGKADRSWFGLDPMHVTAKLQKKTRDFLPKMNSVLFIIIRYHY